jgi:hypothetical protein
VPELPVLDHDAVLHAVSAREAIDRVRDALVRFQTADWVMPPKVYLYSPPFGDFRAMPARGDGLALLKWVTSFPENPRRGLPTVSGVICLSDAEDGTPLMLLDGRSVTALRTGAIAAVAAQTLAARDARSVGIVGCGLHARPHCGGRRGRRCTLLHAVVHFRHHGRAGANYVLLSGRAHRRPLRPGSYVVRAVTGGTHGVPQSRPVAVRFRVARAPRRS